MALAYNPSQNYSMNYFNKSIVGISTSLSSCGSLLLIVTFLLYRDIRTVSRRIIVYISVADLITTLSNFCGLFLKPKKPEVDIPCIVQSFIGTTAVLCSFLWTMMLVIFLFLVLVKEEQRLAIKLLPLFHLISWCVPLTINIVALCMKKLGNSGDYTSAGWCWIHFSETFDEESKTESIIWMFIDGKAIEILAYLTVFTLYVRIKFHLRGTIKRQMLNNERSPLMRQQSFKAAKSADRKLIFIPVVFILLRIWGTIRFFMFVFGKDRDTRLTTVDRILISLQAAGDNLQGAANCVLFCFLTPKVNEYIKGWFHRCCRYNNEKKSLLNSKENTMA